MILIITIAIRTILCTNTVKFTKFINKLFIFGWYEGYIEVFGQHMLTKISNLEHVSFLWHFSYSSCLNILKVDEPNRSWLLAINLCSKTSKMGQKWHTWAFSKSIVDHGSQHVLTKFFPLKSVSSQLSNALSIIPLGLFVMILQRKLEGKKRPFPPRGGLIRISTGYI